MKLIAYLCAIKFILFIKVNTNNEHVLKGAVEGIKIEPAKYGECSARC